MRLQLRFEFDYFAETCSHLWPEEPELPPPGPVSFHRINTFRNGASHCRSPFSQACFHYSPSHATSIEADERSHREASPPIPSGDRHFTSVGKCAFSKHFFFHAWKIRGSHQTLWCVSISHSEQSVEWSHGLAYDVVGFPALGYVCTASCLWMIRISLGMRTRTRVSRKRKRHDSVGLTVALFQARLPPVASAVLMYYTV